MKVGYYFKETLKFLKIEEHDLDEIVAEIITSHRKKMLWSVFPSSVRKVILDLRKKGYKIGIISNSDGRLVNQLKSLKVKELFDVIVDSREVGVEKPNPEIFKIALERLGADAGRTVFVGDVPSVDVAGARAAGIIPVLLDRHDLYPDEDVARLRSISELPGWLES